MSVISPNFKLNVDSLDAEHGHSKTNVVVKDCYVSSLTPLTNDDAPCTHKIIGLSSVKIDINRQLKERSFTLKDEVYLQWTPSFHLEVLDLIQECSELLQRVKRKLKVFTRDSPSDTPWSLLNIKAYGDVSIGGLLSNAGQTMAFNTDAITVVMPTKNRMSLKSDVITMLCDKHEILRCEDVDVQMVPAVEGHTFVDREAMGVPFETKQNRAMLFSFSTVKISFPYKYNFADTFNQRFITITKWLRMLHRRRPLGQCDDATVACDMAFKIQSIIMEIGDDPFETKLRNNYELLVDEHIESEKRKQMLNEKIDQLRRKNFLSDAKLDELREALAKKDADIYIQRHKQLYSKPVGLRHKLFTVEATGLHIQTAADLSFTGYDKLVHILTHRLDTYSALPGDVRFQTIWCRQVKGKIGSLVCRLRDFPKPFMDIYKLELSGLLMGAEQEALSRARRTAYVDLGPSLQSIPIERTMPPLKFYHDLKLKVDTWNYTHGACWDPVLSQLSLSFELISR